MRAWIVLALCAAGCRTEGEQGPRVTQEPVGVSATDPDRLVTPVNQVVKPYGRSVSLPGMRPLALALAPDGRRAVTAGRTSELVVLDPASGEVLQRVGLPRMTEEETAPAEETEAEPVPPGTLPVPDERGQISYTGLAFSNDGRSVYLSNVHGTIAVFAVAEDGTITATESVALPPAHAPRREAEIPAGLVPEEPFSSAPSGEPRSLLLVCGNLSNRLLELDLDRREVVRTCDVGVAPFAVVQCGRKAYVSNWGGRRPRDGDVTGPAGRGTEVVVDPVRFIASEGSVSVVDLETFTVVREIEVRLHSSALVRSPDGRFVVCANAGSDNLSVIDTATDEVVETIWTKASPAELLSATPTALCFDAKGERLYVANGTQNAVAVVDFRPGRSRLRGLIPVGWYPGALAFDARRSQLCVANLKGLDEGRPRDPGGNLDRKSTRHHGSVTFLPLPPDRELAALSAAVDDNGRQEQIARALLPARKGQPPRPVPERIGEPSVFEHVVYVIKENRTYDQVLGDVETGDGDPDLCVFPESVTPNLHALAREFVLLDNTYCAGILSADGHEWSTSAFATDYLERSFAGFPRSYPDGMLEDDVDALAYASSGFLWDHARARGLSIRNFGEFAIPECGFTDPTRSGSPSWTDYWNEYRDGGGAVRIGSRPAIESLAGVTVTDTVGWDMAVPDVWRARRFLEELHACEERGEFPRLTLLCLPNDHTSGTRRGSPTPEACVADNDLAVGRVVEGLSHSSFWPRTVVFVIEDDPQDGWDHVSGYRTTAYVASAYTRRGAVVHTQYNTTSILRTIEQILGIPPMNRFDATATPMFDCFTEIPDLRPFEARPNQVPLDRMNPEPSAIADPQLREDAEVSATLDFAEVDRAPEDVLNGILWRARKGPDVAYPGELGDEDDESDEDD